jgi:oligosaccharide repeat unit polymerase
MDNIKQNRIYLPILLLLSWLGFTIFVFLFGPWQYQLNQLFTFYLYLFIINIALLLGYIFGQNEESKGSYIKINYLKFVEISIIISLIYSIVKLILSKGGDVGNIWSTFINSADTYLNSYVRKAYFFSYLDIIFTPILVIAITNSIFYFKKLSKLYRFGVLFLILISIAYSIGSATRAGIIQLFIILISALMLGIYNKNFVFKLYHKVLVVFLAIIVFVGFIIYSNYLINTRYQENSTVNPLTHELPKKDYYLYKIIPNNLHPLINSTSFYISHSYYRLNRALDLPLLGIGFGMSNSYFIMDNIEQYTGWSGLKKISYGMRLDQADGTKYGNFWSTFYTWIASDFTFPGTIIVVLFIGYLLALALRDSLTNLNPLAVTSFCTLFFLIFSFAFNNPLQDGPGITTNFVIPLLWLITRKKD